MSKSSNVVGLCVCGKKRENMNFTNWIRHTTTCKTLKISNTNVNISKFFKRSASTLTELNVKKTRSGK